MVEKEETEFDRAWARQRPGAPTVVEELVEAVFKSMYKEHRVILRLEYIEGQLKRIGDSFSNLYHNDKVFEERNKKLEARLGKLRRDIKALTPKDPESKPIKKRKKRCASPTSTTSAEN